MKKTLLIIATLMLGGLLFAQNSSKKLITGVYNFATEPLNGWTIYDPNFTSINPISEQYTFEGGFIVKILVGYSRYDFTCTVSKNGNDFDVQLSNVTSYACDKNAKKLASGKTMNTSDKVSSEYAKQMKTEITNRMSKWSDEEYANILNQTITSPIVLECIANNSALIFKKFITDNQLIGKNITLKINVTKVDEAPKYAEGYSYYVGGQVFSGYKSDDLGIKFPKSVGIMVYTNNDSVISLTPADTTDAILNGGQSGSVYEVKGTIKDIKRREAGGLSIIEINE